jgi:hypothetical protein
MPIIKGQGEDHKHTGVLMMRTFSANPYLHMPNAPLWERVPGQHTRGEERRLD